MLLLRSFFYVGFAIAPVFANAIKCSTNEYLVRAHHRNEYVRSDGTLVKATEVKTHCKQRPVNYDYFQNRIKDNLPVEWPHKKEKPRAWTRGQKERLLEAGTILPALLLQNSIAGVFRSQKSKDFPNPASSAKGVIVLYDSAFSLDRNLSEILAHELAHEHYKNLSSTVAKDYRLAAGWGTKYEPLSRNFLWISRKSGFVEEDGSISPEEDYANNIEYFLFKPDNLKKVSPSIFNWIEKNFGNDLRLGNKK